MRLDDLTEANYDDTVKDPKVNSYRPQNDEFHNVLFKYFTPEEPEVSKRPNPRRGKIERAMKALYGTVSYGMENEKEKRAEVSRKVKELQSRANKLPYYTYSKTAEQKFKIKDGSLAWYKGNMDEIESVIIRYDNQTRKLTSVVYKKRNGGKIKGKGNEFLLRLKLYKQER